MDNVGIGHEQTVFTQNVQNRLKATILNTQIQQTLPEIFKQKLYCLGTVHLTVLFTPIQIYLDKETYRSSKLFGTTSNCLIWDIVIL